MKDEGYFMELIVPIYNSKTDKEKKIFITVKFRDEEQAEENEEMDYFDIDKELNEYIQKDYPDCYIHDMVLSNGGVKKTDKYLDLSKL